ncbi:MAG: pyridoxamine 5'-phosphate oxidase family protein [Bacteroidetes bacterium]|nr:pyridoxamine 5'-phosphate oxidase family protein [Bacteroidota bacterium]
MVVLPTLVIVSWDKRVGPIVFSTVDADGIPNSIYATCVSIYNSETIIIVDYYFDKTRKNVLNGSKGSVLFLFESNKYFQLKGRIEYHKTGNIFNDMKKWNPTEFPDHAAAAPKVEAVYSGSKKL